MKERRRFYRINDSVILNYQPFPEDQLDERIAHFTMLGSQHRLLQSSLTGLELRLEFLLDEISEPLPEIAEALKIINRKLGILSHLGESGPDAALGLRTAADTVPTQQVNLSGSGLAFHSPTELSLGETMEIEFVLFPEYYNVKAIGKVVACRERNGVDPDQKFEIAVDFVYLKEEDQEFIVAHVLRKQGEEIKRQKELEKEESVACA